MENINYFNVALLWWLICAMSYKRDFGGFLLGDLSPRQAKIRQTEAKERNTWNVAFFWWRGVRSPCENIKKSPVGGFSRGAFSRFCPENTLIRHGTNQPPYFTVLDEIPPQPIDK